MYDINRDKQFELLRWLFTSLDGQWLSRTAGVYGPGEASKLNGRVHNALGRTAMKAMLSLVGKSKADNLTEATEIIKTYLNLVYGERGFNGSFRPVVRAQGQERLEIEVVRFSAMDGIKKVAQAAGERVGLAAEGLWSTWFETLLPDEQVEIAIRSNGNSPDLISVTVASESFVPLLEMEEEELSPIAALLQLPLEPNQPASPPPPQPESQNSAPYIANGNTSNPQPSAAPMIGAGEPGADRSRAGALNQRLSRPPEPNEALSQTPVSNPAPEQSGAPWVPSSVLRVNPTSGRPLFAEDMEEDAKKSIEKRKAQKGLPLMSRLMLSKEAKEMIQNSGDVQPVQPFSLASGIEAILQRLINQEQIRMPGSIPVPVHVVGGPDGELQIHVGPQVYGSVGDVPPGRIKELLQQAVNEWMESQEG